VAEFVGALGAACFSGYAASLEVAALALAGTLLAYGGDLVFAAALTALAAALSALSNRLKRGAEEAASRAAVSSVGDVDAADGSALTRA